MDKKTVDVSIRKANISDLSILQKLGAALIVSDNRYDPYGNPNWYLDKEGEKYLKSMILGRKSICYVAELKGEIIGYICGKMLPFQKFRPIKRTEIDNLIIKEEYRGKGAGSKLISAIFNWSKYKGAERIILHTKFANKDAIDFYKKYNFSPLSLIMEAEVDCA